MSVNGGYVYNATLSLIILALCPVVIFYGAGGMTPTCLYGVFHLGVTPHPHISLQNQHQSAYSVIQIVKVLMAFRICFTWN